MINQKFNTAFESAEKINKMLQEYGISDESFIDLDMLVKCIRISEGYSDISIKRMSFSKLLEKASLPDGIQNNKKTQFGAMLGTTDDHNGTKIATIIINTDYPAEIQRFSVAHELGHLITHITNFAYESPNDNSFTISAYTNPDITFIDKKEYENNDYLIAEQVANIFALLVLIRKDIQIKDITSIGAKELSEQYGVTEEAIYSRMILSNMSPQELDEPKQTA